ncbi:MAG: hypothetical protein ACLT3Y_07745 [Ruminococcus callidus]
MPPASTLAPWMPEDNMLCVTNDGRKIGLDAPDEPLLLTTPTAS